MFLIVCGKEGRMKKRVDKKPWRREEIFALNEKVSVKIMSVDKGRRLSLQKHTHRDEFLRVIEGVALITLGNREKKYSKGGEVFVKRGVLHRIKALSENLKVLEISFGKFDKNDIERLEDDYGRVK